MGKFEITGEFMLQSQCVAIQYMHQQRITTMISHPVFEISFLFKSVLDCGLSVFGILSGSVFLPNQ